MNQFNLDLLRLNIEEKGHQNTLFSPASIEILFAMILSGSQGNIRSTLLSLLEISEEEVEEFLTEITEILNPSSDFSMEFSSDEDSSECTFANSFWYHPQEVINQEFEATLKQQYFADAYLFESNPLASQAKIDQWVATKTRQMILELPLRLDNSTIMVLINALYVKASWSRTFDKTEKGNFNLLDGNTAPTEYMIIDQDAGSPGKGLYLESEDFQLFAYLSKDERIAFVMYLPRQKDGLPQLMKQLTSEALEEWEEALEDIDRFYLKIPKFELEDKFELDKVADKLGLEALFSPSPDLNPMFETSANRYFSEIGQPCKLKVHEKGLEASAVSYATMSRGGGFGKKIHFEATHPFYFQIQDIGTGQHLFHGIFTTPTNP